MIDGSWPISRTQVRTTALVLVIGGVVGIVLFGGLVPGLRPDYSAPLTVTLDGHSFYFEFVVVPIPSLGTNTSNPVPVEFHGVLFHVWLTNWGAVTGDTVDGNATVANGTVYEFALGAVGTPPHEITRYISPDYGVGAVWQGGLVMDVLTAV